MPLLPTTVETEAFQSLGRYPALGTETFEENILIKDCSKGKSEWWLNSLNELPNKFKLFCRLRVQQCELELSIDI